MVQNRLFNVAVEFELLGKRYHGLVVTMGTAADGELWHEVHLAVDGATGHVQLHQISPLGAFLPMPPGGCGVHEAPPSEKLADASVYSARQEQYTLAALRRDETRRRLADGGTGHGAGAGEFVQPVTSVLVGNISEAYPHTHTIKHRRPRRARLDRAHAARYRSQGLHARLHP